MQLIECVPNFSEGRDRAVIDSIAAAVMSVEGAQLLDIDPGADTNRTVMTLVGDAAAVEEAAFRAIARAAELIDMRSHTGEHPRMGATDVCPFVPVQGATMDDCVAIARRLGDRVGSELGIPVHLYEEAATVPERRSLSDVRRGEYEGLASREDPPDFGPAFNETAGATAIGARSFLIAYNINLNTTDRSIANRVAGVVRGSGVAKRDESGAIVRDADGKAERVPGIFPSVKGVGWYIAGYGRAQVSLNLTDIDEASLHDVFDACAEAAAAIGARVTGSELVGLVPRRALLSAGDHYLRLQGRTTGIPEAARIHAAVLSLGLAEIAPFDPAEKVIEYRVGAPPDAGLQAFVDELSSDSFAPGGGSVAALCGSLAAALASMVAVLTHRKTGELEELGTRAQALKDWFLDAVARDAEAYNAVIAARRLPRKTKANRAARDSAIEVANQGAARVPLEVLEKAVEALELCERAVADGNDSSITDAGVGALCAHAAARGAAYNVAVNLPEIGDEAVRSELAAASAKLAEAADAIAARIAVAVDGRLSPPGS